MKKYLNISLAKIKSRSKFRDTVEFIKDSKTIIQSKGRVANADLPHNMKYPLMISRNHKLTDLIVWDSHDVRHRSEKQMLTQLRAEYLTLKGKSLIKKVDSFMGDGILIYS